MKTKDIIQVINPVVLNEIGRRESITKIVEVQITRTWIEPSEGRRYAGHLINEEDIELSKKIGKSKFPLDHYKQYGTAVYLEIKEKFDSYDPKEAFFGEKDIIKL